MNPTRRLAAILAADVVLPEGASGVVNNSIPLAETLLLYLGGGGSFRTKFFEVGRQVGVKIGSSDQ